MTDWQPIESAPKDGTGFDAWDSNAKERVTDVYWHPTRKSFFRSEYELNFGYVEHELRNLSHWLPLPQPPETQP